MKDIVILGGGSAGWMSAAYFYEKCGFNVTVIDNIKHPRLELSASTTPYLKRFFKDIGIENESEWMPACKATYKIGVLYEDWHHKGSKWWNSFEADEFYHLYWNKQRTEEDLPVEDFFKARITSSHVGLDDLPKFIMNEKGEMGYDYSPIKSYGGHPEPWAYHIDTGCFNTFLRERYENKITFLTDEISEIRTSDKGIDALVTPKGKIITADLFIDCSGFKATLIEKVNPEGRIPMKPYLTHDKAIVVEVPYKDADKEMKTRTLTKAMSSGWMWNIALYDRMVNGYVYTSDYISDEDAEKEMLEVTAEMFGEDRVQAEPWIIDIRTGHHARPWYKNVLALGVSAGFVEPMEATLLMITQFCLVNAKEVFAGKMDVEKFNDKYEYTLMDTLDWVSTQYYLTDRDDSEFWRFKARNKTQIRPRMVEWLESCKKTMLPPEDDILFYPSCWYAKLVGSEEFPEGDGFDDTEGETLPSYSNSNFKPQNKFKYKEMDELNARMQMDKKREFDPDTLLSHKEYLDRFIYNVN